MFVALFGAELRAITHDTGVMLFFLFLPLAYPVVYSLIYNPELVREVDFVVVDHDRTPMSRKLVRDIDASQWAHLKGYAADMHEGRRAVSEHECYGILEIPQGFSRHLGRGETANAVLYTEMSLLLRYRGLLMASTQASQHMGAELLQNKMVFEIPEVASIASAGDPMPIDSIQMGNTAGGFDSFLMPGVIVLILHQCIILAVGMIGGAKHEGTPGARYMRLMSDAPVWLAMTAQTLCYLLVISLPMIFLIHYVPLIFSFPMAGNTLEIMAYLLPMVLACIFLGLSLQSVVTQRESIFLIWVVTSVMFIFLSGLTWPRYAMHGVWRMLSDLVPATWGVDGFIKMNTNGSTIAQVMPDYRALWILAAAYGTLAYTLQRVVMRPRLRRQDLESY